ncbi:MAG: DUF2177 family protein [Candidatus Berkiella sp.]
MERYLKVFILSLVFCFIMDMLWLGLVAKAIYQQELSSLLRKSNGMMAPNWISAVLVYIALISGILFFVIPKFPNSYHYTWLTGALFGLIVYSVYDCTNYAVLQNWTLKITIVDILWGIILCSSTSVFALYWHKKFS